MFSRCCARWTPGFFAQPQATVVMSTIPQHIHFIWAGGTKIMSEGALKNILKWKQQNPRYAIYLWVDHTSHPELETEYQDQFAQLPQTELLTSSFIFRDIAELRARIAQLPMEDATTLSQVFEISRYEMTKSYPNYGKSSDLLRYLILYLEGGIYLDSDVLPDQGDFSQCLAPQLGPHILWVDTNSQGQGAVGNDAFAVTLRHPFFLTVLQSVLLNYITPFDESLAVNGETTFLREWLMPTTLYFLEDEHYRELSTIMQTGPRLIRDVLDQYRARVDGEFVPTEGFACFPFTFKQVTSENTRSWLQPQRPNDKPYETCLMQAANAIQFEVNTLRWLRMVDHVQYILKHTLQAELRPTVMIVQDLIERLTIRDLQYTNVRLVQVGYLTKQLTIFYEQWVPEQYQQAKQQFFPGEDLKHSPLLLLKTAEHATQYVSPDDTESYLQLLRDYVAHSQCMAKKAPSEDVLINLTQLSSFMIKFTPPNDTGNPTVWQEILALRDQIQVLDTLFTVPPIAATMTP